VNWLIQNKAGKEFVRELGGFDLEHRPGQCRTRNRGSQLVCCIHIFNEFSGAENERSQLKSELLKRRTRALPVCRHRLARQVN
jgi:hypothetical protein